MAGKSSEAKSLRATGVLARTYFADFIRNPTMFGAALVPVAAAVLFRMVSGDMADGVNIASWLDTFYTLYAFIFAGLMVTAMHVMYDMGEETEKGGRGVLFRAGVTPVQLALGHMAAASALLLVLCASSCIVLRVPVAIGLPLTALGFACLIPLPLIGCACALFARTQNEIMIASTPLCILSLVPFVLYLEADAFGFLIPFVPTGGMLGIAEALTAGNLWSGQGPLCLIMTGVWLAVALGILAFSIRRFEKTRFPVAGENASYLGTGDETTGQKSPTQ